MSLCLGDIYVCACVCVCVCGGEGWGGGGRGRGTYIQDVNWVTYLHMGEHIFGLLVYRGILMGFYNIKFVQQHKK